MIFIIHSLKFLKEAVELEKTLDTKCYIPGRDTPQNDGNEIIKLNRQAMSKCDAVYVIWDGVSQGTLVDIGMAMGMEKDIFIQDVIARSWTPFLMGKVGTNLIYK